MSLNQRLAWVADELSELCATHQVPGAAVGVLSGEETATWVWGVTSLDTAVEVTADTVFQIGSNTKLYTATLVMILVQQGLIDLDARITDFIPSFRTREPDVSARVSVRQLLTHTSGIDGDFPGPEPQEFCVSMLERYVEAMADLAMLHAPGEQFSYCNSGYVLLGRVIEVVTGLPYSQAFDELLNKPIGLVRTRILPQDIVPHRAAVGHLPDLGTGKVTVAPAYVTAPACAPAGSCPVSTVGDVLEFLSVHLNDGRTRSGNQLLRPDLVAAMQTPQVKVPPLGHTHAWGLGWMLGATDDGQRWIGHTGGTLGQISFIEVLPEHRCAVVVLTNAVGGAGLGLALVRRLLSSLTAAVLPNPPSPPEVPAQIDLQPYAGRYERRGTTVTITPTISALEAVVDQEAPVPTYPIPQQRLELIPVDRHTFVTREGATIRFCEFEDDGRPAYLFNSRLLRRRN